LWSEKGIGQNVKIVAVPDDREEANYVVSELQKQQLEAAELWKRFAIIFRMNAQSRLFEEQLRRLQIPYRIIGGRSFFERREVKDLLAYLACLANPHDDLNLLRIINTPARGIGASTIGIVVAESNQAKTSIFATLQSPGFHELLSAKTKTAVHGFIELIDRYETQIHQPLVELATIAMALLQEIRYPEELRRSCKTPEEALNREENVRELVRTLADYQRRSTEGLSGFLAEVALDREREEETDTDKDGVTLITFHAAKGLEFPHVFLIGIEEGILPHDRSKLEGNLDEERRLFYVGITRAMQTLTITHCANRNKYGGSVPSHPSSFLKDLDPQYVEIVDYHQLANQPASEGTARSHFAKMRELLG
ncbi:MAG: ATP-dependent helicase, partial [Chthoniobacterales bacterium]